MKLYFLNVSNTYHYDSHCNSHSNEYDPYYIFTDDLSLLKTKCVEKYEDETQSIPYIYQVNTKNLNLLSVNDSILNDFWKDYEGYESFNDYLESIEDVIEDSIYEGEFDFGGLDSFIYSYINMEKIDGLTDFPIWDPEKGAFVPKGVLIFNPYKKTDYPTNISEERLDDFVDYLEDELKNSYEITISLEDGDEVELPIGVFSVMRFYDLELSGWDGYGDFMSFLKETDDGSMFNKIVKNNGIYDNEEQIKTAIERFNFDNINRYTFGGLLFDIFKDEYNLEYILENFERIS